MGKKFFEAILADEDRFNRFFNLAWKQQDTDNSGELDAAELEQTLDQFFNSDFNEKSLSADEIKALVAKFDTDKSGKVSKDEFKKLLREYVQKSAQ